MDSVVDAYIAAGEAGLDQFRNAGQWALPRQTIEDQATCTFQAQVAELIHRFDREQRLRAHAFVFEQTRQRDDFIAMNKRALEKVQESNARMLEAHGSPGHEDELGMERRERHKLQLECLFEKHQKKILQVYNKLDKSLKQDLEVFLDEQAKQSDKFYQSRFN